MKQEFGFVMQDNMLRKAFGNRLKQLRKNKDWTQKDLAAKLGIRFGQLNKYECGLNAPPMEKLVQMAELLDVTMDYLLTGDGADDRPLHNTRLLERFHAIEEFEPDDRETIIKLIDAMIVKHRVEGALSPID
jgi:transcriptional regulator with XRE-family HTH domain